MQVRRTAVGCGMGDAPAFRVAASFWPWAQLGGAALPLERLGCRSAGVHTRDFVGNSPRLRQAVAFDAAGQLERSVVPGGTGARSCGRRGALRLRRP
jgi:hypothetical protein